MRVVTRPPSDSSRPAVFEAVSRLTRGSDFARGERAHAYRFVAWLTQCDRAAAEQAHFALAKLPSKR